MATHTCWHCPATFAVAFGTFAAGMMLVTAAVWLGSMQRTRILGRVVGVFAVLWLVLSSLSSLRNGVSWSDPVQGADAFPTLVFAAAPFVFLAALAVRLRRIRRG